MKTFEEKLDAWLDGKLTGNELTEFEASLPPITESDLAQQEAEPLTALLKEHIGGPALSNEDFFNHQLRTEIEREEHAAAPHHEVPATRESWWSIGRLIWTGTASLAVLALSTVYLMRDPDVSGQQSAYLTQIINARVDPAVSPNATISIFETKEDKVTVLWVDGLQSLPSEYAAK
ncbi:hypothetical protein BH20VER1_BH20VER1_24890 [soil metagenome]